MELRHLRYFTAVAEELHFGRAADRLRMAQPPLSQHILNLEKEIGVRLFERTKRKVELTEAGRIFLEEAQLILQHAEQAVRAAQRASRGEVGRLRLGFVMSATCSLLPPVLRTFRARYPAVELVLEEATTESGLEALRERRLRACLLRLPINSDKTITAEPVLRERVVLALPAGHRLAALSKIALRALAAEPFILFPRSQGPSFYDQIVSFCRRAGFSPRVAQEATQMQTILSLVAADIGVALVPETVCSLRAAGVVYRPLSGRTLATGLALAWRRDDTAPLLTNFLNVVRAEARQISRARKA